MVGLSNTEAVRHDQRLRLTCGDASPEATDDI